MLGITPCLWFNGEAEQAAEFYTSVLPNSRILSQTRFGDGARGEPGQVMTVNFELDGREFVGLNGGPGFSFTEAVSFQLSCENQEEVDRYWNGLSAGGEEGQCGWLKDRFGLSWQVVPTALPRLLGGDDPAGAQRALTAMLGMKKLDIAAMERAYAGE